MTKVGILVCLVIVAMDDVAGILGIKAEVAKNKVIHMRQMRSFGCKEPSPEAFKLGLAAALLQALAHITANLLGGCTCICCTEDLERSASNRQFLFTCLILSWDKKNSKYLNFYCKDDGERSFKLAILEVVIDGDVAVASAVLFFAR
ncbi:hypothetical protein Dsin_022862 [Dipteronia sinensis]|uniref:Uncharacterized protein n=1 Tax=Dipteronia sinensis TaxID=43782 RepID=A0AAE0A398_9ROSI|nr:hypothetical protein Dsin_022862 [Dipteronia sinensis]